MEVKCPKCSNIFDVDLQCTRCKHKWTPKTAKKPKVCPKCKSPYWSIPRRKPKR